MSKCWKFGCSIWLFWNISINSWSSTRADINMSIVCLPRGCSENSCSALVQWRKHEADGQRNGKQRERCGNDDNPIQFSHSTTSSSSVWWCQYVEPLSFSSLSFSYDWPSLTKAWLYGNGVVIVLVTGPCSTYLWWCAGRRCCLSWPSRRRVEASRPGCCCSSPTGPCHRPPSDLSRASHLKWKYFTLGNIFIIERRREGSLCFLQTEPDGLLCCWQLKVIWVISARLLSWFCHQWETISSC